MVSRGIIWYHAIGSNLWYHELDTTSKIPPARDTTIMIPHDTTCGILQVVSLKILLERSIGLCAKVAKVESGNNNARSDDDDDDSNVGCGDKLNPASRVDKIFISPDGVEF